MPFDTNDLIIVLQGFNYWELIFVHSKSICDYNVLIEASTCYISTVSRIWYSSYLLLMKLLMSETLSLTKVPYWDGAICVAYRSITFDQLLGVLLIEIWAEAHFIHFREFRPIHWIYKLFTSYVPNFYCFVCAYWDGKGAVIRSFNWVDVTLMPMKIRHILSSFSIPHFHIIFHETSRK